MWLGFSFIGMFDLVDAIIKKAFDQFRLQRAKQNLNTAAAANVWRARSKHLRDWTFWRSPVHNNRNDIDTVSRLANNISAANTINYSQSGSKGNSPREYNSPELYRPPGPQPPSNTASESHHDSSLYGRSSDQANYQQGPPMYLSIPKASY